MVFLINADARNIISTQATFITRYEDSDKKPVRYLYITAYKLNMEKIGLTSREYYGAAEPPVRCGESHLSGLTEPPHFVY